MTTNEKAIELATRLIKANIAFDLYRQSDGHTLFSARGKDAVAMRSNAYGHDCNLEIYNDIEDLNGRYYASIRIEGSERCELCSVPSGGGEHVLCEYEEKFRAEVSNV